MQTMNFPSHTWGGRWTEDAVDKQIAFQLKLVISAAAEIVVSVIIILELTSASLQTARMGLLRC